MPCHPVEVLISVSLIGNLEINHGIDNQNVKAIKDGAHIAPRLPSLSYISIALLIRSRTTSLTGCVQLLQGHHRGGSLLSVVWS